MARKPMRNHWAYKKQAPSINYFKKMLFKKYIITAKY